MSGLSGYDSEAVGFESISRSKRSETSSSTQTNFEETGTGTQTNFSRDCGVLATAEDFRAEDDILKEYPPPGLNEFLRKVVPSMLEQLEPRDQDCELLDQSDEDEDETLLARLFQELQVKRDMPGLAAGDFEAAVLALGWSSAGHSLAVSIGTTQHEDWCQHSGLIRIYTIKRSKEDTLVHSMDISEKNCVTVLKYHPSVSALLAYGTATGEVVLCNLRNAQEDGYQLCSPSDCHGSKRVNYLYWADASLANIFLTAQIMKTGKRRNASDQILISAGSDATINVFQVNSNLKIFECIVSYSIHGANKMAAPDITCFDFIKTCPLRPSDEKVSEDIFVVGTKSGSLFLCKIKTESSTEMVDPVYDQLDGHQTCILDLSFSFQRPGIFASVSIDSEVRVYDVKQTAPLKIICLEETVSCLTWLPNGGAAVLAVGGAQLRLLSAGAGRSVRVAGLKQTDAAVNAVAVSNQGACLVAVGDNDGVVRVWNLPARRFLLSSEDIQF